MGVSIFSDVSAKKIFVFLFQNWAIFYRFTSIMNIYPRTLDEKFVDYTNSKGNFIPGAVP